MKALRFERTGSLAELKLETLDQPVPKPGEILVKVQAAAINPSDVKNVLGKMEQTTLPRTPGRDFAGWVQAGPAGLIDCPVFGTGGDLGFLRDGSHAEYVIIPVEAAVLRPDCLTPVQAAAIGLGYLTAWKAVVDAAQLREGETILITGVTGAVGSAAAYLAKWIGARVLGTIRRKATQSTIPDLPVDYYINLEEHPLPETVWKVTDGHGADVVLDNVGGPLFDPCLRCLAPRGRQVAIASTGDPHVHFNLVDFYHREGSLIGLDTLKMGFAESATILRGLLPHLEQRVFKLPELETVSLAGAADAYQRLHDGTAHKKLVIVI